MIKLIIFIVISITTFNSVNARKTGETEITTEDGIEVFQEEKYYLLKKNVEIVSDELELQAQIVKIHFEDDLYDIKDLDAKTDVSFVSNAFNIKGSGNNVKFNVKDQIIMINGENSELYLETTQMFSDGNINVNNLEGSFIINGPNSILISDNIYISGYIINGEFKIINEKRDISNLIVEDKIKLNIKTQDTIMFSKKAIFNKEKSIIELFEEVEINRGGEIITGDYGILDTKKNSYKVSSNKSKKVKAIISSSNE